MPLQTSAHVVNPIGTVSYGDFTFPELLSSVIEMRPVYNKAETTTKYNQCELTITATITAQDNPSPGVDAGENFENLKNYLQKPGLTLVFQNKGFSEVGTALGNYTYGPKPQILTWEQLAGPSAIRVTWSVTFVMLSCNIPGYYGLKLVDFLVVSSLEIKDNGYQVVTKRGYIEAVRSGPGSGDNNKVVPKLSEEIQKLIQHWFQPEELIGYNVSSNYEFSNDDRSCEFTLVFTEIESENPYPYGVYKIDATHGLESSLMEENVYKQGFATWLNTFSATIELFPRVSKHRAWHVFIALVQKRIKKGITVETRTVGNQTINTSKVPIILHLSVEEGVFSNTVSFNIVWSVSVGINAREIQALFQKTGMFDPVVQGVNYSDSDPNFSMAKRAQGAYPIVAHGAYPSTSLGSSSTVFGPCNSLIPSRDRIENEKNKISELSQVTFNLDCEHANLVVLDFQNEEEVINEKSQAVHRKYVRPNGVKRKTPDTKPVRDPNSDDYLTTGLRKNITESDYVVQEIGADRFILIDKGFAIRIGKPLPAPSRETYAGKKVRLMEGANYGGYNSVTKVKKVNSGGCVMYVTAWRLYWEVLGSPDDTPLNSKTSGDQGQYT